MVLVEVDRDEFVGGGHLDRVVLLLTFAIGTEKTVELP